MLPAGMQQEEGVSNVVRFATDPGKVPGYTNIVGLSAPDPQATRIDFGFLPPGPPGTKEQPATVVPASQPVVMSLYTLRRLRAAIDEHLEKRTPVLLAPETDSVH